MLANLALSVASLVARAAVIVSIGTASVLVVAAFVAAVIFALWLVRVAAIAVVETPRVLVSGWRWLAARRARAIEHDATVQLGELMLSAAWRTDTVALERVA